MLAARYTFRLENETIGAQGAASLLSREQAQTRPQAVTIRTVNAGSDGSSGKLDIETGSSTDGTSGGIMLSTGDSTEAASVHHVLVGKAGCGPGGSITMAAGGSSFRMARIAWADLWPSPPVKVERAAM